MPQIMAKKKKTKEKKKTTPSNSQRALINEVIDQYKASSDAISTIRDTWEEKEAMLLGSRYDSSSKIDRSDVFDPRLATIILERGARVMAQPPTGKVQALSRKDVGKSLFMNTALQNYIIPNANTQFDFLTKSRMWNVYSNVYGTYCVLIDYVVRDDYVGPDFWLIPIRDFIPQQGKISIEDSDYCFVRSVVSKKWLLNRKKGEWENIDKLLEKTSDPQKNKEHRSFAETKYGNDDATSYMQGDYQEFELITRYERDRWVTFSKDGKLILRDVENKHENDKIPVVAKHAFPLIDRFYGLGEFERGQSLQYSINSLIGLYLEGVKMSIFPPLKVDLQGVVPRTIVNMPGAKWVMKNGQMNAVQEHSVSPRGLDTFQNTYQFLIGALLNQAGTTDTTIPAGADFSQGKTPQALRQLQQRENSRDNWDRFMQEKAMEKVLDIFVDLMSKRQEKPLKMHLFDEDLHAIHDVRPDVVDMFESGEAGEVTIKPEELKETNFKFFIDAGTTMKKDEKVENETLTSILTLFLQSPTLLQEMRQKGKDIDFAELFKRWIITSGVQDWDKIFIDSGENAEEQVNQESGNIDDLGMQQAFEQTAQPAPQAPELSPEAAQILNDLQQNL